jgi:hypothetical protein
VVKGYAIDLSAQLDSLGLIYAWFDHAMREGRDLRCWRTGSTTRWWALMVNKNEHARINYGTGRTWVMIDRGREGTAARAMAQ